MSDYHARIGVRVYRERGALLARLAHDLQLEFEQPRVEVSGNRVDVQCDPGALRVVGALTDRGVDPTALDASARTQITSNVQNEVLRVRAYPDARFRGEFTTTGQEVRVVGELQLHGQLHPVTFTLTPDPGPESKYSAELTITPSRWGIAPFRALLGALKLQDKATLQIEVSKPTG